jgi:hypothetical protein
MDMPQLNGYMTEEQIAELDENIRELKIRLAQYESQRVAAFKAKLAFSKYLREIRVNG